MSSRGVAEVSGGGVYYPIEGGEEHLGSGVVGVHEGIGFAEDVGGAQFVHGEGMDDVSRLECQ